jgi:succinate dehydrogenase/fumarate reductase-like Fe-S protein
VTAAEEPKNNMSGEISVSVWRGGKDGRYETYSVPRLESQTVLDVVTFVQRNIDPTLSYRFACRVGVCGSRAMTVNGKPRCAATARPTTRPKKLFKNCGKREGR